VVEEVTVEEVAAPVRKPTILVRRGTESPEEITLRN
jgi:hypothetical protein